nr:nephrin-like [Penaeus vannamei]
MVRMVAMVGMVSMVGMVVMKTVEGKNKFKYYSRGISITREKTNSSITRERTKSRITQEVSARERTLYYSRKNKIKNYSKGISIARLKNKFKTSVLRDECIGNNSVQWKSEAHIVQGKPRPQVSWWHEGSLLDDVIEMPSGDVTRNILTLPNLTRQHLYRVLTCQASNSNMSLPSAATVTLDMSYPPLEVNILGSNAPLSEGERYSLVCEASGSRPAASLTWWMEGVLMTDTKDQILQEGNVSRSTLHVVPTRSNDGDMVSCRAENAMLEGAAMEDTRKLIVYYAPKLVLRPGMNLNMSNIKEGEDVYFECDIQANPKVFRVQWFQNGQELHHNVTAGVILSNPSLVLQRVTRKSSGHYTCRAINLNGEASSNAIQLSVKFAPVCSADQKWVYGGGRHQPVNVTCNVESHPEASTFKWAFNTSSEYVEIPQDRIFSSRSRSMVAYTPQTHHDFGSLLCWGVNDVENQKQPCVFHIVPAAVPEPVHNCSVWHNASAAGEVVVACEAGWSGGLTQTFTLEVRSRVLAALRDQPEPHFTVTGLAPGTEYRLAVVASNAQGAAPPTVLVHLTPIDVAEKRTSPSAADSAGAGSLVSLTPILAVLLGVAASLVVCSVVLVVVMRARSANARARAATQTKIIYDKASPTAKGADDGGFVQQERGPDIILVKSDTRVPGEDKQLVRDYLRGRDGSFYINPGSLLNNGAVVTRETEALLPDPTTSSSACSQGAPVTRVTPSSSSSSPFLASVTSPSPALTSTDSLARSSFCSGVAHLPPPPCRPTAPGDRRSTVAPAPRLLRSGGPQGAPRRCAPRRRRRRRRQGTPSSAPGRCSGAAFDFAWWDIDIFYDLFAALILHLLKAKGERFNRVLCVQVSMGVLLPSCKENLKELHAKCQG